MTRKKGMIFELETKFYPLVNFRHGAANSEYVLSMTNTRFTV